MRGQLASRQKRATSAPTGTGKRPRRDGIVRLGNALTMRTPGNLRSGLLALALAACAAGRRLPKGDERRDGCGVQRTTQRDESNFDAALEKQVTIDGVRNAFSEAARFRCL